MSDVASTTVTATPETTTSPATPSTSAPPLANSPEARTAEGTIKDVNTPVTAEPAAATAPEAYTFKSPEGFELDSKLVSEVTPIFKEMNLPQDAAQKLVDWYSKIQIANNKAMEESVTKMRTEWRDQISKDPELGTKLDSVKTNVGKALTTIANGDTKLVSDFKSAMDLTGAGDNLAIVKIFNRLANAVNEGTPVSGLGPSEHGQVPNGRQAKPSAAAAMYPNLPH